MRKIKPYTTTYRYYWKKRRYRRLTIVYLRLVRILWYPQFKKIEPEVTKLAKEQGLLTSDGYGTHMGVCHDIWALEKQLMQENFHVDWPTPPNLHPDWHFD